MYMGLNLLRAWCNFEKWGAYPLGLSLLHITRAEFIYLGTSNFCMCNTAYWYNPKSSGFSTMDVLLQ